VPEHWFTLIAVVDDATKQVLHARLWEGGESVTAVMTALRAVIEHHGLPMALYTDRAHWAVHTPVGGWAPDRRHRTQGRPRPGSAWRRLGMSVCAIARALNVTDKTIAKALRFAAQTSHNPLQT